MATATRQSSGQSPTMEAEPKETPGGFHDVPEPQDEDQLVEDTEPETKGPDDAEEGAEGEDYKGSDVAPEILDEEEGKDDKEQVDEDPPEETEAKKAPAAEVADPVLDALIDRARDIGLTDGDIGEFDTPEALEKTVRIYERRLMASLNPQQPVQQQQIQQQTTQKVDAAPPAEDIPDLDPKEYDEGIVKGWGAMKSMVKQLQEQNKQFQNHFQARQQVESDSRFDGYISKLGDEYKGLLGKGSVEEIDHNGKEFKARLEVRQAMYSLGVGYHNLGKKIPPEHELFKRALQSVFGNKSAELERSKIVASLKKRKGQFLGRATARNTTDSRTPDQRARDAIRSKMKDKGLEEVEEVFQ